MVYVKTNEHELSINQAIELSGVTRQTLSFWLKRRLFKWNRRLNNQVIIDKEDFLRYIQERGQNNN
mgnify:CR=1 FL=1